MAGKEYPFISVLIPTRNRWVPLLGCLESLMGQDYPLSRVEMLVFDDGGSDGTSEKLSGLSRAFLQKGLADFRSFRCEENRGLAEGRGLLAARMSQDSEMALFLDDDLYMSPGCLKELVLNLEAAPDAGAAGPKVVAGYDRSLVMFSANFVGAWTGLYSSRDSLSPLQCDWLDPACLLVRKKAMAVSGGFAPVFYRSHEGADFCLRLKKAGYPPLYVPGALAVHHTQPGVRPSGKRLYYLYRNKFILIHRNFPAVKKLAALVFTAVFGLPKYLAESLIHNRLLASGEWKLIFFAVYDGLLNRGGPGRP